jgi:hypothetical protein
MSMVVSVSMPVIVMVVVIVVVPVVVVAGRSMLVSTATTLTPFSVPMGMPRVVPVGMLGVMRMGVEPPDQKKRQHQTADHPADAPIDARSAVFRDDDRVGELVEQADAEH